MVICSEYLRDILALMPVRKAENNHRYFQITSRLIARIWDEWIHSFHIHILDIIECYYGSRC